MNEVQKLQDERNKLFSDFSNNIIPKRMPIQVPLPHAVIAEYGGIDAFEFQYDYSKLAEAGEKFCDIIDTDACPVNGVGTTTRIPSFYQFTDAESFKIGGNGQVQHPETIGMLPEDYDYLIEDPYACLLERVIPRQYKALGLNEPIRRAQKMDAARASVKVQAMSMVPIVQKLITKKGYYSGAPFGSMGFTEAPFDFIGDLLRGFSGISMDIRRDKKKLIAACDAVFPLIYKFGLPENPHPEGIVSTPLHMPTFMRNKDVEDMWFPTYNKLLQQYSAKGVRVRAFCEDNWMRYLDLLQELPAGHILCFEYGDPKAIKEKLGNKFIIAGLFPLALVKSGTKQQCVDKAKELLDIMLPGGGYMFGFDKIPLTAEDVNLDNLVALLEFVKEYSVYPNAGESFGTPLNVEGFKVDESITRFKSKYNFGWDEFKKNYPLTPNSAREHLEKCYDANFKDNLVMLF